MKKSLGQHFLKSEKVLDRILEIAEVSSEDLILEIGPGAGALTKKLLEKGARVIAVEKDDLLENFDPKNPSLTWVHQDVLEFDMSTLSPSKVVANIPYYLSSLILEKLLREHKRFSSITLLVQKEFAEKILSMGHFLSLYSHLYFRPTIPLEVGRHHFNPPPNVTSAILHLSKESSYEDIDETDFLEFAKTITSAKRKTLKSLCPSLPLKELQLPETLRLGELSFADLIHLYRTMKINKRGESHNHFSENGL